MSVRYNTVLNCAAVAGYEALARIAAVVGETGDSGDFAARAAALREAILTRLYDPATGISRTDCIGTGTGRHIFPSIAAAYALYAGVYRDSAMADWIAGRLWERSLRPRRRRQSHPDERVRYVLPVDGTVPHRAWKHGKLSSCWMGTADRDSAHFPICSAARSEISRPSMDCPSARRRQPRLGIRSSSPT